MDAPVGIASVKMASVASLGPLLTTVCVYMMLSPAATLFEISEVLTLRSAMEAIFKLSELLSLAVLAVPPPPAVTSWVSVAAAVWLTFTVIFTGLDVAAGANEQEGQTQETCWPLIEQDHPAPDTATGVRPLGTRSVRVTGPFVAPYRPAFVAVMVRMPVSPRINVLP